MTRSRTVVLVLAIVVVIAACAGGRDPDDEGAPRAANAPTPAAPQVETAATVARSGPNLDDQDGMVVAWAREATQAAGNGPTVLLRFARVSRQPGLVDEADCIPPFAGALRDDPSALADPSVTRRPDGTHRVRGTKLSVDVAVEADRVVHLEGCGGPAGLLDDAEEEQREAAAAAAREVARKAAEQAAEREREARAQLEARRAAEARADAAAARDEQVTGDVAPDDRVEVFPRDGTSGSPG